jgi:hypothetical protein
VVASATTVTEMFGVGPIIAGLLIGYSGDITRFATAGHYAADNGTTPIEFSSSGRVVHRLSRRGNRTLNHAIHMIAVTQIRHRDSEGRRYYDRKARRGTHPARGAQEPETADLRSRLPAPARRRPPPARAREDNPGGDSSSPARLANPGTPALRTKSLPDPPRRYAPPGDLSPDQPGAPPTARRTPLDTRGIDRVPVVTSRHDREMGAHGRAGSTDDPANSRRAGR